MTVVAESQSAEYEYDDAFPWDSVGKRNNVGVSCANKVVAQNIAITLGYADLAVCRKLDVSLGRVMEAIVFEKVSVGMGLIEELHCLSSTTQGIGMGGVQKVIFHSVDELVQMALEKLDMDSLPAQATSASADGVDSDVVQARAYLPSQDNETQDDDELAVKKARW